MSFTKQNLSSQCSIIIPALNEEAVIRRTLESARACNPLEIIVVDGGSTDETFNIALVLSDHVITSAPGRALQQHAGANMAQGEYLLFLHADCMLMAGSLEIALLELIDSRHVCSCMRQHIPMTSIQYRWLEWGNIKRVVWWQMVYGDQGICLRKKTYQEIGGFPDMRLMEDVELSRRLKKHGKIVVSHGMLEVNPRRWIKHGVFGQTWRNWIFVILYRLGFSTETLERWYRNIR